MNLTLVAASSSQNSIFFKIPFESCSPKGILVTLDSSKLKSFLFEHEVEGHQNISSVTSNLGGDWTQKDDKSGVFRLVRPTNDASLIVTTTFTEPLIQSTAVQFGNIVSVFTAPPADDSSLTTAQEYIFVLDCSGSMTGGRIQRAKECLQVYLHSLPFDGYFNIVCFGSNYRVMWDKSKPVNQENIDSAVEYTNGVDADLGGTEMSRALNWIFNSEAAFPGQKRQLFILTDGEDFHPDEVMSLVSAHRNQIRCFTIGLGHGADPGLVKGIATRTNGRFDFVYEDIRCLSWSKHFRVTILHFPLPVTRQSQKLSSSSTTSKTFRQISKALYLRAARSKIRSPYIHLEFKTTIRSIWSFA
jgi:hypothetical protein